MQETAAPERGGDVLPSCRSGPDLVLILLSPSKDARIGDNVAIEALPPASLSCPFLPSLVELDLAEDVALLGVAAAATNEEPKSLSRFLEVSDLVFLSNLEEEAGEAVEAEPGAKVAAGEESGGVAMGGSERFSAYGLKWLRGIDSEIEIVFGIHDSFP
jgi:hypothetical protein